MYTIMGNILGLKILFFVVEKGTTKYILMNYGNPFTWLCALYVIWIHRIYKGIKTAVSRIQFILIEEHLRNVMVIIYLIPEEL